MFLFVMHKHWTLWHISSIFNAIFKRQLGACLCSWSRITLKRGSWLDGLIERNIYIRCYILCASKCFLGVKVFILIPLEIKRDFRERLD